MNLLDRGHSYLTRWHSRPDMGQRENLAEHMGWVARLSMLIANELPIAGLNWKKLYEMALLHDDAELIMGDVPGGFKNQYPEARETIKRWEGKLLPHMYGDTIDPDLYKDTLYEFYAQETLESKIVKVADTVAALAYADMQVKMGNQFFESIATSIEVDAVAQLQALPIPKNTIQRLVEEIL